MSAPDLVTLDLPVGACPECGEPVFVREVGLADKATLLPAGDPVFAPHRCDLAAADADKARRAALRRELFGPLLGGERGAN